MDKQHNDNIAKVQTEQYSLESGFKITRRRRAMDSVEVLTSELRSVGSANFQFTLFAWLSGIASGALVSVGIALATITFTNEQVLMYAGFLVSFLVSLFAFLAFTCLAIYYGVKSNRQINDIIGNEQVELEEQIQVESKKEAE